MKYGEGIAIGSRLRNLRESRGEPLRVVAASVQIDSASLSKIERGDRLPTDEQTTRLAEYFGIATVELQAQRAAADFIGRYGTDALARRASVLVRETLADYGTRPQKKRGHT